jgi:hypothetical protein
MRSPICGMSSYRATPYQGSLSRKTQIDPKQHFTSSKTLTCVQQKQTQVKIHSPTLVGQLTPLKKVTQVAVFCINSDIHGQLRHFVPAITRPLWFRALSHPLSFNFDRSAKAIPVHYWLLLMFSTARRLISEVHVDTLVLRCNGAGRKIKLCGFL